MTLVAEGLMLVFTDQVDQIVRMLEAARNMEKKKRKKETGMF